jgi:hypothetical protein
LYKNFVHFIKIYFYKNKKPSIKMKGLLKYMCKFLLSYGRVGVGVGVVVEVTVGVGVTAAVGEGVGVIGYTPSLTNTTLLTYRGAIEYVPSINQMFLV